MLDTVAAELPAAPIKATRRNSGGEEIARLKRYYYQMLLIRQFEERAGELARLGDIGGHCHLNLGEEATVVGLMAALEPCDYIFTNYREHGYMLARGVTPRRVMAELLVKATGVSRGRGGSMHLADRASNFMGGYAIVGGQIPLAVGVAFALKYQGRAGVVLCQMGDAATNIGAWHESLNLARLYQLPIIFFIVNNGYAISTPVEQASAEPVLARKGCAYRIYGERVDGTDVLAVRNATRRLRQRAQADHEPIILETISSRFGGHAVADPAHYRTTDELRVAETNDPLPRYRDLLRQAGAIDEAWLAHIADRVVREVQTATDSAHADPDPQIDDLLDFVYASPVVHMPGAAEAIAAARAARGGR